MNEQDRKPEQPQRPPEDAAQQQSTHPGLSPQQLIEEDRERERQERYRRMRRRRR